MTQITFLRHGNTEKGEDDKTRVLSEKGLQQALTRGNSLRRQPGKEFGFDKVIVSPALRCCQTAKLVCDSNQDHIVEVPGLYPVGKNAVLDDAFARLGYSPLATYLADSEAVAREILAYGFDCWEQILNEMMVVSQGRLLPEDGLQFLVVIHAVLINSIGFAAMMEHQGEPYASGFAAILHTNFGECEGFSLNIDDDGLHICVSSLALIKDEISV